MATEEITANLTIDSNLATGVSSGQRLTIANRTVSKLSFHLGRVGSPGGTLTLLTRKVSGDGIIVSKLWGNSNDVSTTAAWYEVTFDAATFINEEVYILALASAGAAGNVLQIYRSGNTDVRSGEYAARRSSGGNYTYSTGLDMAYIYTFAEGGNAAPVVTTQACTYVIAQSATGNGNLQSLGTSAVTQHGHCWNTSTDPTTSNSKTENGATANLGPFQSSITALIPGTKYYVRAYAVNTTGTSYGANVEVAGDVTTIGKRYWWVEGKEFHYYDQWGAERKVEGVPDASGLPWWWYY